ncbi:MAG: TIGR04282 family arsenosugar biosynthesis glycosyltransferase [Candidatus Eisenbacteria bacterium]
MHSLGILARHPVAGRVKSRLSPALPAALAARLYAALLADTRAAAAACTAARTWWWADAGEPLADIAFDERAQPEGDLGARLAHAVRAMRAEGGSESRVVVVGSDCPALATADFDRAFAALARADVVLGPAADGGYWLLGARLPCDALFEDIAWSTPAVYAQTCARAAARGWSVEALEEKRDLDTPEDLVALVAARAAGRTSCGPALHAALKAAGLAR